MYLLKIKLINYFKIKYLLQYFIITTVIEKIIYIII
jgi:hypothetical protein